MSAFVIFLAVLTVWLIKKDVDVLLAGEKRDKKI